MNELLQERAARFIENRDAIRAVFKLENDYIYPVCAHIYLAANRSVEREQLERCRALVKSTTGLFSSFRGNVKLPLICMLAAGDEPEERWARMQRTYALLKQDFPGSEYLALGALLLTDAVKEEDIPALAARGKGLYRRMRKEHPFLTGQEDSVFALLLAQSPRSDDELLEDMEACYALLDERFPKGDGLQTTSHVLAASAENPTDKAYRVISLYNTIEERGGKYGKDHQLPILAALTLEQRFADDLARDILELDAYLAQQKGYRGVFGMDRRTRTMHAAMLLSLPDPSAQAASLKAGAASAAQQQSSLTMAAPQQTTLAMIAVQQALMCAVLASSAASSASTSGAH